MPKDNSLLPDAAVQAIQDSVKTEILMVNDREFVTRPIFIQPPQRQPEALKLNTLKGLVDYLRDDLDGVVSADVGVAVQVVDHEQVDLVGALFGRDFEQRNVFATVRLDAIFNTSMFTFGRYYDLEEFNIKLRTLFEPSEEREELLKLLGNIKEERVRTTEDDGISQTVIARVGIASVAEVRVPSPVRLAPFRTFREVWQPASDFIIRLKAGDEDELPTVALFEADGGKWKLDAIENIRSFFAEQDDLGIAIFA